MATGLSIGRVTDVSKSITPLNISTDGKKYLKEMAEEYIRLVTKRMETATVEAYPDAKTILDIEHPQLSLNRVRGLMGEVTDLNQSAAAAITIKSEAESLIKEVVAAASNLAISQRMKTIKGEHIEEIIKTHQITQGDEETDSDMKGSMNVGKDLYLGNDELKHVCGIYTKKRITPEAIEELRCFLEEEISEVLFFLEESLRSGEFQEIKEHIDSVRKIIDQGRIRGIIRTADELADERGKKSIDVVEICDGFTGIYQ